jgi:hypothetical protein
VAPVRNAPGAHDRFRAQRNMVLIDLFINHTDVGWRLLQALAANAGTAGIPVFVALDPPDSSAETTKARSRGTRDQQADVGGGPRRPSSGGVDTGRGACLSLSTADETATAPAQKMHHS